MLLLEIYTVQISNWRLAVDNDIPIIDTTIKTGAVELAPTWDMVWAFKGRRMSEEEYTKLYTARIAQSHKANPDFWNSLLAHESMALACYCPPNTFCHRHLLKEYIESYCLDNNRYVECCGELE